MQYYTSVKNSTVNLVAADGKIGDGSGCATPAEAADDVNGERSATPPPPLPARSYSQPIRRSLERSTDYLNMYVPLRHSHSAPHLELAPKLEKMRPEVRRRVAKAKRAPPMLLRRPSSPPPRTCPRSLASLPDLLKPMLSSPQASTRMQQISPSEVRSLTPTPPSTPSRRHL